jgi:signal transduction histidine kinase
MYVVREGSTAPDWASVAEELRDLFQEAAYELRFSLDGEAAVRVLAPRGPVARRHAEPPEPSAPWSASARCGDAIGWLLAEAPPSDQQLAGDVLQRAVERQSALLLQRLAAQRAAMEADLLEHLTHRLRTDVSTLQAVAEGAVAGVFDPEELRQIPEELKSVGGQAQRALSDVREVMTALDPGAPRGAEPVVEVLSAELEGAGLAVQIDGVDGERPMAVLPGAGWSACARLLAEALAGDERLGGAGGVSVRACPRGWAITAGVLDLAARPVAWTEQVVGALVHAGQILAAAGGWALARQDGDRLGVELTLPAAPSG